ncbi:MAG TPA: SAM-dependent methyltransferase [Solirubrobacteraceae bacterium]|jgi:methyltransferase (TIGR00027 family)|nr:SAM-dependent methyltransferase [Solirubrobacteraceae bacterium]
MGQRDAGGSETAQRVAALRAGFDRPSTPEGDPDAQRAMCRGMRPSRAPGRRRQLLARTRFFDRAVLDALGAGIGQVVIVGAGYDDRALRFRTAGATFFELDHPATQADKRRRLEATAGGQGGPGAPVLAPLDLRDDDVARVLDGIGHAADRPSLFICEGLLVYLTREAIAALLGGLAARAGSGSTLALSLAMHAHGLDSATVIADANAGRRFAGSEPWLTIMPLPEWLAVLRAAGWREERGVASADLVAGAADGRSALVLARPAAGSDAAPPGAA